MHGAIVGLVDHANPNDHAADEGRGDEGSPRAREEDEEALTLAPVCGQAHTVRKRTPIEKHHG